MAPPRHPLRRRIIARIRRGELASVHEIMLVASIPRQTANRWLREEGIDLGEARMRLVAKMHDQEERFLSGKHPGIKPTKAQMRASLSKAIERFNRANAKLGETMA